MKHVHCDMIKAWADGAKIQVKSGDNWISVSSPYWLPENSYRLAPKIIKQSFRACLMCRPSVYPEGSWIAMAPAPSIENDSFFVRWIDTEWREIEVEL